MPDCYCWSVGLNSNQDKQKMSCPITLDPNRYFDFDSAVSLVSVDCCITGAIKKLWENNIWTINSCCGHNGAYSDRPSIVLDHPPSKDEALRIRELNISGRQQKVYYSRMGVK